jgi:hypothetical protein
MVAERAGLNATTAYRRWPDADPMINDIATYRLDTPRPTPEAGDRQSDISQCPPRSCSTSANLTTRHRRAEAASDYQSDCVRGRLNGP